MPLILSVAGCITVGVVYRVLFPGGIVDQESAWGATSFGLFIIVFLYLGVTMTFGWRAPQRVRTSRGGRSDADGGDGTAGDGWGSANSGHGHGGHGHGDHGETAAGTAEMVAEAGGGDCGGH